MTCQICGGRCSKQHSFREMMFGTRKEFLYWECEECGCLQIAEIPQDLADYYPASYYSFRQQFSPRRKWFYRSHFQFPRAMKMLRRVGADFSAVAHIKPERGARILDVGCGSGKLVEILRSLGFEAFGIDPFLGEETQYLSKCSIQEVPGTWDLIMFHHVLEHMPDQIEVLRRAREKLSAGGTGIVRIPVATWAWEHYGRNWVQIDAPRHLIIHTPQSFCLAAESAGFRTVSTLYDSTSFQFWGSELYSRDLPLHNGRNRNAFSWAEMKRFEIRAEELNRMQKGDQAAFILKAK